MKLVMDDNSPLIRDTETGLPVLAVLNWVAPLGDILGRELSAAAWLPITDAQRDGREVLATHKEWSCPWYVRWDGDGWRRCCPDEPLRWTRIAPTHFFPLPEFKP